MQTKRQSAIESTINILVGYFVALLSQIIIFPFFGIHASLKTNIWIGIWFTVVSFFRSYFLRRYFNWAHSPGHFLAQEKINGFKHVS